ncbi:VOC family protein [Streptomyces roseicoloratus]|uniref:VOC family protein n=1 Tax=Streptomyces roseicoloratus TaxID=2508722 RepID=A0ABY9S448_9ACTN|nr:VOC family protein [Streptomyces roseicoloratus]WMX48713.1 VOC family protein [Streptomyces roseicoloratus]
MFGSTPAFSSFSVDDLDAARAFYGDTLGLQVSEEGSGDMRMLFLTLAGGARILVYPKGDEHSPAGFTVLNFQVDDIDAAVDALKDKGVEMQRYPGFTPDDKGVHRDTRGPAIAWFTDPAKNVIAVLQN